MHDQRTISNGDVKVAQNGNLKCRVSEQKMKRHSLAFLFSLLSGFFCLDSLFWHGLASLNLVISTQHHYSAQIDFDMHEFKLFLFIYALRYHHVFAINERRANTLHNEACSLIKSCMAMKCYISLIKRVSFSLGRTVLCTMALAPLV